MNRRLVMTLIFSLTIGVGVASPQAELSDRMEHSTVRIIAKHGDSMGEGSGFVIGDKYIVTNYHVVAEAEAVRVFSRYGRFMQNDVTGFVVKSPEKDIAVLKLAEPSGLTPVVFATRASVHKLQPVLAAGFPGAANLGGSIDNLMEVSFTQGIISGFIQENGEGMYQISAAVNPGNSGGPLFDQCGRVIGINSLKSLVNAVVVGPDGQPTTQRVPLGENIAWAIQADELIDLLQANNLPVQAESNVCGSAPVGAGAAPENPTPPQPSGTNAGTSTGNRPQPVVAPNNASSTRLLLIVGGAAAFVVVVAILIISFTRSRKPVEPPPLPPPVAYTPQKPPPPLLPPQTRSTYDIRPAYEPRPNYESRPTPAYGDMSAPRLRGISGTHAGMEFPLSRDAITLGRDPKASQIVFKASDNLVSKRHCTIRFDRQAGGVILEDCGSMNGTYLENGERLRSGESRVLSSNGRFYLGSRNNMFQVT